MSFRCLAQAHIESERILWTYFKCILGTYFDLSICGILRSVTSCIYKYGQFERTQNIKINKLKEKRPKNKSNQSIDLSLPFFLRI